MELKQHFKIMILEDNEFYNKLLAKHLKNYIDPIASSKGFTFELFSYTTFNDCKLNLNEDIDFILCDYYLSESYNALHLLELIKQLPKKIRVIVLSRTRDLNTSIRALLKGAAE